MKRKMVPEYREIGDENNSMRHNCPYGDHFDEKCAPSFCDKCEMAINKTEIQPQRGSKKETKSRPGKEILSRDDFFMALVCHRAEELCNTENDCKIAFCLAIDDNFVTLETCSNEEDCGKKLSITRKSVPNLKCTLYINIYPDDKLQEIIAFNGLKQVVYMPEYDCNLEKGIYKRFRPQEFSCIQIEPHSSHKLETDPTIKVPSINDVEQSDENSKNIEKYYICVSYLNGMRSKDPSKQVGACIVDKHQKLIGMGYNKSDELFDYARLDDNNEELKCEKITFAEEDAFSNAENNKKTVKGCTIYSTILPGDRKSGNSGSVFSICEKGIDKVVYTPTGRIIAKPKYAEMSKTKFSEYAANNKNFILRPFKEHLSKNNSFPQEVDFYANVKRKMSNLQNN